MMQQAVMTGMRKFLPKRRIACAVAAVVLLACLAMHPLTSSAGDVRQPTEHEVKVALLYKFANFVDWSEDAMQGAETFRLCMLGESPFGEALQLLEGKRIKNRPLELVFASSPEHARGCHIIFVNQKWNSRLGEVLEVLGSQGVLFVGDGSGFARRGGVLEFALEGGRVGFAINPEAARREGLVVSSKLMRLARIVETD